MNTVTLRMRSVSATRSAAGAMAVGVVLAGISACSIQVTDGKDPPNTTSIAHSQVRDGTLTVDLRTRPTREAFGMATDATFSGYGSTDHPIRVVVRGPAGDLVFEAADITAATDAKGGATDRDTAHAPKYFTVYTHYPDAAAAAADAASKSGLMGFSVQRARDAVRQTGDLSDWDGKPDGWRSTRLGFSAGSDGYTGRYFFDVDVFHNAAVDQIKHGDVVDLDLRHSPTRTQVGLLPTYLSTEVRPEPGRPMTLEVQTPSGTSALHIPDPADLSTEAAATTGPPRVTTVGWCEGAETMRRQLTGVAAPFGLDRQQVRSLPVSRSRTEKGPTRWLSGRIGTTGVRVKYEGPGSSSVVRACAIVFWDYPG